MGLGTRQGLGGAVARLAGAAAALALATAGCQRGWSDEERRSFLNDCLTNARIDDETLRENICSCWLERTAEVYSLDQVNGGDQQVNAAFLEIGKACSAEHGVRAQLPEETPAPSTR